MVLKLFKFTGRLQVFSACWNDEQVGFWYQYSSTKSQTHQQARGYRDQRKSKNFFIPPGTPLEGDVHSQVRTSHVGYLGDNINLERWSEIKLIFKRMEFSLQHSYKEATSLQVFYISVGQHSMHIDTYHMALQFLKKYMCFVLFKSKDSVSYQIFPDLSHG